MRKKLSKVPALKNSHRKKRRQEAACKKVITQCDRCQDRKKGGKATNSA